MLKGKLLNVEHLLCNWKTFKFLFFSIVILYLQDLMSMIKVIYAKLRAIT